MCIEGMLESVSRPVRVSVTSLAECDEIGFIIVTGMASKLEVMDLQVFHCSATLTPPAIAL
jgi:hypothetical protein